MKTFNLQHPKTRSYINEFIFHKILAEFGFVTLRYDFIRLEVNGEDFGIYAMEEHFEKKLLENNKREEGIIVRFPDGISEILSYGVSSDEFLYTNRCISD